MCRKDYLLTMGAAFSRRKPSRKRFYAKKQVRGVHGRNWFEMRGKMACLAALIFQTAFQRQTFVKSCTRYENPNFCGCPLTFTTHKAPFYWFIRKRESKKGSWVENGPGCN